ncbi:MAG TPA: DnaJ domain-containing protein [Micropepsaceae bacterium]|nr:DnaJ domain-containing protein [Micropepsaceae bacterium]
MSALLAGLALLALLLLLARGYTRSDPKQLVKGFRFSGGILLVLLTVAFILLDRFPVAILSAGGAWVLLFRTVPPWHRPDFGAGGMGGGAGQGQERGGPPRVSMSRAEALKVLGLEDGASEDEIRAAHRRLILQTHPDKGGTSYLAAKINEAKDVLLRRS